MDTIFKGIIIEESLKDLSILKKVDIISTKVEKVTPEHKTPWIKQWTMHTVEIPENEIKSISEEISKTLDTEHEWYADFKNKTNHYIVFRNKVFAIDRKNKAEYDEATKYGISVGIPDYQVDFSKEVIK